MYFIAHRINKLGDQNSSEILDNSDGIEFDLRSSGKEILVVHDPFENGQNFSDFSDHLRKDKFYIVNIKTEGIEEEVVRILDQKGIHNFFLLDCGMPAIVKLGKRGETRIAVRLSEYEGMDSVHLVKEFVQWVWIDTFTKLPLTPEIEKEIHGLGLKIALVSPELQKQQEKIEEYRNYINTNNIKIEAVCTKYYNFKLWIN
jgi:hypothetical protein